MVKIGNKRLTTDLLAGLGLRGLGAVSSFAFAWLIAQFFGARIVGLYQVGYTTAVLLAAIAVLSMDVVLVRKLSPLIAKEKFAEAAANFSATRWFVFRFGLALAIVGGLLAYPFAHFVIGEPDLVPFIALLAPVVVLLPLLRVHNALLRSLGQVWVPQSLEGVLYVTIAIAGLAALAQTMAEFTPLAAPLLLVVGMVVSVVIGYAVTRGKLRSWPDNSQAGTVEIRSGTAIAAAPIITQSGQWVILLAITSLMSAADAGVFRIAVLICMLMELVNTSFATMAGPYLSRAAAAGDQAQIRKTVLIAGSVGIVIASPVALAALLAPQSILGLFGEEFVQGALALQLLAIGQLINVLAA